MQQKNLILLADDDHEDIELLLDVLEDIDINRHSVATAINGVDALNKLNQYTDDELPCLVILDLNMPMMGGTETLRQIKANERLQKLQVVIYSTSENPHEKELCTKLGALDYVTKPVLYEQSIKVAKFFKQVCDNVAAER